MKKRILVLFMAILCLSLVFAFASCGGSGDPGNGDDGECSHEYGEWEEVTPNGCASAGLEKRTCSKCGEEETQSIPASHKFGEWTVEKEATCSEDGLKSSTCTVCGNSETEVIVSQGHKKKVTTAAKQPTAEADGCTEGAECESCGEVLSVSQVLAAYSNAADAEKVTVTSGENWPSFSNNVKYLFDGKNDTAPFAPKGHYTLSVEMKEGAYVLDVIVVCNGAGTAYNQYGSESKEQEARVEAVKITCFKDGKEVVSKTFEDTTALNEVKLEGVNTYIDSIQIEVTCVTAHMWGSGYLWEINAYGTYPVKECDVNGHTWGDWNETKAPVCTEENELTDGEKQRECSVCGEKEKETIKAAHDFSEWGIDANGNPYIEEPKCGVDGFRGRECKKCYYYEEEVIPTTIPHNWGEWNVEGLNCTDGGTKTRTCQNDGCGKTESETVAAGEHVNIVTEGYVAPTTEAEGQTGVTKCTVCGTVISQSKVITKLENLLVGAKVESSVSSEVNWAMAERYLLYIIDGNRGTGLSNNWKSPTSMETITLESESGVNKIVIVVNGKGTTNDGANPSEKTNLEGTISFMLYDASGKVTYTSQSYNTLDMTEIVVELPETVQAKQMKIIRNKQTYSVFSYIWEVEMLSGGLVTEDIFCDHDWSTWEEVTPAACDVNGLEKRSCTLCNDEEENIIPKLVHNWGTWSTTEGFNCTAGGTRERTCTNEGCGKTESETIAAGEHIELVTEGKKAPTVLEVGSTGTTKCTVCDTVISNATEIPKLVNQASNATVDSNGNWPVVGSEEQNAKDTRPHLNDGDMNTGVTCRASTRDVTHEMTWESAVTVDTVKLYFSGDGTNKDVGYMSGNLENTNPDTKMTVTIYNGENVVKTENIATKDLTEYTISLGEQTEITRITIFIVLDWITGKCVNIWECQAFIAYVEE